MPEPTLTSHQRAFLKSMAHPLQPVVMVGADGLSAALERATEVALADHELIKVRLGQGFSGDRKQAAAALARSQGAALVQLIGRVIVLYRPRAEERAGRPRIRLPG